MCIRDRVCTVYSTTWEEETQKATNPVTHLHSTPIGRHRQHDWPRQAVWIGTGPLCLEKDCRRLLYNRQMMMMMRGRGGKLFQAISAPNFPNFNRAQMDASRVPLGPMPYRNKKTLSTCFLPISFLDTSQTIHGHAINHLLFWCKRNLLLW